MPDIRLNPVTGDVDISKGKICLTESGAESVAQRIRITLQTNQGEWDFNLDFGVRYYDLLFKKSTSKTLIDAELRSKILAVPGVAKLNSFVSSIDARERKYKLDIIVTSETGDTINLTF